MEEYVVPIKVGEKPTKKTPDRSTWKSTKAKIAR